MQVSLHSQFPYRMHLKSFFLILGLLFASCGFAQAQSKAVKLYNAGNKAFAQNNYRAADSLFSLSLDLEPHPDAYYNRAVCRRKLGDAKGYCIDLGAAANMGDKGAYKMYWKQCAKCDTIYKKENGDTASAKNFDIKEYTLSYRYTTDFEYEKYGKGDTLLLSKVRNDNIVFYRPCNDVRPAIYKGNMDSLIRYIKEKTGFMEKVKMNHWINMATIRVQTNEKGKITDVSVEDKLKDNSFELLDSLFLLMPEWNPATLSGRPVKFQSRLYVTFFDTTLSVMSYNAKGEIFTAVETMPEFPGGPIEMMKFIMKNLDYPQSAKEAGLYGKCFLRYVINPDGSISAIEVLKGVPGCPECDKAATRAVAMMPKWKPATQNGNPVPVFFNLPINFQLR